MSDNVNEPLSLAEAEEIREMVRRHTVLVMHEISQMGYTIYDYRDRY